MKIAACGLAAGCKCGKGKLRLALTVRAHAAFPHPKAWEPHAIVARGGTEALHGTAAPASTPYALVAQGVTQEPHAALALAAIHSPVSLPCEPAARYEPQALRQQPRDCLQLHDLPEPSSASPPQPSPDVHDWH